MPDFNSILSKPALAVEKPKPKPTGFYIAVAQGLPEPKTVNTKDGERGVLTFTYKIIAPRDGVDPDQLAASGDISAWMPVKKDIWYDTPEGEWNLRQHLTGAHGINPGTEKSPRTFSEMLADVPGGQVLLELKHRPYTDKNTGTAEIATDVGTIAKL